MRRDISRVFRMDSRYSLLFASTCSCSVSAPAAALTLQEQVDAKRREYRESIRKTQEMSRRNAKKALKKTGDEVKAKRDRLTEDRALMLLRCCQCRR